MRVRGLALRGLGSLWLVAVLILGAAGPALAAGLSVATGQAEYTPGAVVTIAGGGAAGAATVAVQVDDPAGNKLFVDQVAPSATGAFSDSFTLSGSAPSGTYTLYAAAAGGSSGQSAFQVAAVAPAALRVATISLPGATKGAGYSTVLAAAGGTAPYTWSVVQGSLPAGLALSGDAIAGTPTLAGVSIVTLQARDAAGGTASQALSLFVTASGAAGATGSSAATTGASTVAATAGGGGSATPDTTAQATGGIGSVATGAYAGDPEPGAAESFQSAGGYFDVAVAPGSTFADLTVTQCGLAAGDALYWWDGSAWAAVSPQSFAGGCITADLNTATSSPTIAQLGGTPFAAGLPQPPSGSGSGGGSTSSGTGSGTGGAGVSLVPVVSGLRSTSGPAGGGTAVTVTGAHLTGATAVDFGSAAAMSFTVLSDTQITAVSPAGTGTVDVTVTTPYGTSATSSADQFSYKVPVSQTVPAAPTFSDVSSSYWAYASIEALAAKGIVGGFPDGTFQPDGNVTRAQFVKMLALTLGLAPGTGATQFSDVASSDWFAPYVSAAVQAGVVQGLSATTFGPNATVTREQMAVLLARALKLTKTATLHFTDDSMIDAWATTGVEETVASGYINGFPDGSFQPLGTSTRAQAAKVLAMVLNEQAAATGTTSTSGSATAGASSG